MLRAILFDFNGILVDDEPVHLEMFQRVLAEEGISLTAEEYYRDYLGLDDRGCFGAVLQKAGEAATVPRLMRLIARKASYYQERMRQSGYPFFPGSAELVRELASAGRMLGIVSGALREEVEGALRQAGLLDRFKLLVTAEDVSEGKPDPEGYRRALEGLSSLPPLPERLFHPHEVLAVEDSPAGLSAAADLGLSTLGVAHTYPPERLRMADAVAASLEGMTVERLEQLLAEATPEVSPLDPGVRRQAEQLVRPLYAGLDGVQTFGQVERLRVRIAAIRGETAIDEELLELLLLFQGVVDRLGSLAPGSRLDLFLKGLGLADDLARRVRAGLGRLREDPRGPEEEMVHDALLLESAGVVATAERLMAAGKKRTPVARALAQLDPGPAAERYRTPRAGVLGAERRREAEQWIEELRRRVAEEGIS